MKCTVIVGAGGTGSYVIEDIVNYYNTLDEKNHIVVVDGDVVEEKNLLRQGFLKLDLGKSKAESLVSRYQKIARENVTIEAKNYFIGSVKDVVDIVTEDNYQMVTIVSCVDNNVARLRLTFAMYAVQEFCKVNVSLIDSGNEEWHGQTITSCLVKGKGTYLTGLYQKVNDKGFNGVQDFELQKNNIQHMLASIFTTQEDWKSKLTKGDHELSCEDVTESSPQNIGTNMMASKCLLMTLGLVVKNRFTGGEYNFNAKDNTMIRRNEGVKEEEGYGERLQELVDYIKTEQGYKDVFEGTVQGAELKEESEGELGTEEWETDQEVSWLEDLEEYEEETEEDIYWHELDDFDLFS